LTANAEFNKMYVLTHKIFITLISQLPITNPTDHTNITSYAYSPCSAHIRVSGHRLIVANVACEYFSIIRTYFMARYSVSNFNPKYTRETLPGALSWPLHLTPTLRSDAAISLLHLYAKVAFTATAKPGLNAFASGLIQDVCYSLHHRRVQYFDVFLHNVLASTCLSCRPPDLNFLVTFFPQYLCTFKITTATGW
jgi:hypothetical protein